MAKRNARATGLLLALALLPGCAAHSFPLDNQFIGPVAACGADTMTAPPCAPKHVVQLFSDMNGTLFPSGWQRYVHPRMNRKRPGEARWLAGNLLAQSVLSRKFRGLIERDNVRQLAEIQEFARHKKRIFILVHGFNTSVEQARVPFELVESNLALNPDDGVIRFYWDGLIGKGVGAIKTWFQAANASQMVGARGLRGVLNAIEGREVYLISHSRGASVVLSALGNPIYEPKFLQRVNARASLWGKAYRNLTSPVPLRDRGNRLHLLMLAPAVDRIDFCNARAQPKYLKGFVCPALRELGDQVISFSYTVNVDDPILTNARLLSRSRYATGLGYRPQVGSDLKAERYPMLQPYLFSPPQGFHGFAQYAADPAFLKMLGDAGIARLPAAAEQSVLPVVE